MIVLDTAPWIWWVADPGRLSRRAREAIAREEKAVGLMVSAISVWEVALKHSLGRLLLDRDILSWIALARTYPGIPWHVRPAQIAPYVRERASKLLREAEARVRAVAGPGDVQIWSRFVASHDVAGMIVHEAERAGADFVVLGANPLTSIGNSRRIESVWIGGQRMPMASSN